MSLDLRLPDGGDTLAVIEAVLRRGLGQAVGWSLTVPMARSGRGADEATRLAGLIEAGPVRVDFQSDGRALSSQGVVIAARWSSEHVDHLIMDVCLTAVPQTGNVFTPRWRVHRVSDMGKLLDRLKHVAVATPGVLSECRQLQFPDGDKACVVQAGVSDWDLLHVALAQCELLTQAKANWTPLTLLGGSNDGAGTRDRWVIAAAGRKAYKAWNDVSPRKIAAPGGDAYDRQDFGALRIAPGAPGFGGMTTPDSIHEIRHQAFETATWTRWSGRDLPLFFGNADAFVWQVEDRLYVTGQGDEIAWTSRLHVAPGDVCPWLAQPGSATRPWMGQGTVEQSDPREPWLSVRLAGFEQGDDLLNVRLLTAHSGRNGKKGLHLVPESKTEVVVAWPGAFGASPVMLGNRRMESAEFDAPSLWLESDATNQFEGVEIKKVGSIRVGSQLEASIDRGVKVESAGSLIVRADGADLRMSSGVVRTGRGV